jgi:hypothetical protein
MKDGLDQSSEDQDAVFRFLADPAMHDGAAIKRINTHAASVFLAGPVSVSGFFHAGETQGRVGR